MTLGKVGTDLFEFKGKSYLKKSTARASSGKWTNCQTHIHSEAQEPLCQIQMISDNGPQFTCREFKPFAQTWKFEHRTISPGDIQANSKVESPVKTAKRLLQKACKAGTDPYLVILHYRNTLTQGVGVLMSCRTKTLLPATSQLLQPQPSSTSEQRTKLVQRQIKQKLDYDRHAKDLQPLSKGDIVCVKPF